MKVLGMDIGTMFIVSAAPAAGGTTKILKKRDCFVIIKGNKFNRSMYTNSKEIDWMPWNEDIALIGDAALSYANSAPVPVDVRRPLKDGILNKTEKDAFAMLRAIVESVAGSGPGMCTLSIPAPTIGTPYLVDYHRDVLLQILGNLGWTVTTVHEGYCVVLSALSSSQFTGIGISFGGGMVNVSFSFFADELFAFSMQQSGDWVDEVASESSQLTPAEITELKENDFSLDVDNIGRDGHWQIESAYRKLIEATIENICVAFDSLEKKPRVKNPIPIVIAGGTSMVPGFVKLFESIFRSSRFPVPVGEITHCQEPLYSVAKGALVHSTAASPVEVAHVPAPAPPPPVVEAPKAAVPAPSLPEPAKPAEVPVAETLPEIRMGLRPVKGDQI